MNDIPATKPQTFAIFCALKYDVRECNLTKQQASEIIALSKTNLMAALEKVKALPNAKQKGEAKPVNDWQAVYDAAHLAGKQAGDTVACEPMVVVGYNERHVIEAGVCGFASINISPGTCSFAKWLVSKKLARSSSQGGVTIYVHDYNQSLTRKEAYAYAFAHELSKHNITAYANSRID